jgi:hypothetical protein
MSGPSSNNGTSSKHEETEEYSGLNEIEDAFDRVSSVADALLDSIRDDSLRGKQRRASRKRVVNITPGLQDYDDDTDEDISKSAPNFDDDSILTYGDGDDVSLDGSLAQDLKQLRSVTKAINDDLTKEDKEFHENVSTGSGRSYFARKEKEAEAATPVFSNLKKKTTYGAPFKDNKNKEATSISMMWEQLERFCSDLLGQKPSPVLMVVNIIVWLIFCKFIYNAKVYMMNDDGTLSPRGLFMFSP